jgi:hypothetical protein
VNGAVHRVSRLPAESRHDWRIGISPRFLETVLCIHEKAAVPRTNIIGSVEAPLELTTNFASSGKHDCFGSEASSNSTQ